MNVPLRSTQPPVEDGIHLELILANTNHTHPPRGVSTNDFANLFNAELINIAEVIPSPFFVEKELKDINIVEAEASRIKIIQSFYERRGYAQIGIESMLDADGRVILDKSINYGKQ